MSQSLFLYGLIMDTDVHSSSWTVTYTKGTPTSPPLRQLYKTHTVSSETTYTWLVVDLRTQPVVKGRCANTEPCELTSEKDNDCWTAQPQCKTTVTLKYSDERLWNRKPTLVSGQRRYTIGLGCSCVGYGLKK